MSQRLVVLGISICWILSGASGLAQTSTPPVPSLDASALFTAVQNGEVETIETLLARGTDVNAKLATGWTALWLAISSGQTEAAKLLIKHGADVNVAWDGMLPLQFAEQMGRSEIARVIKEAGGRHIVAIPIPEPATPEALFDAAAVGDTKRVKTLLAHVDANVTDAEGWTPLMFAALGGHAGTVEVLTAAKAKVNAKTKDGATPLMAAVLGGDLATVRALVARGANVSATTQDEVTALIIARQRGLTDIERVLETGKQGKGRTTPSQARVTAPSPAVTSPDPRSRITQLEEELRRKFPWLRLQHVGARVTFTGEVPNRAAMEEITRLAKELGRTFSLVTVVDVRYPKDR